MDIIVSLFDLVQGTFLPFLFVLMLIIFIHELGHFLVARAFGVHVCAFSIGFGPELYARVDKRGTRWRIAAIPLGGYVNFLGDGDVASLKPAQTDGNAAGPEPRLQGAIEGGDTATSDAPGRIPGFHQRALGVRAAIVAAGPLANFLFAIAIFAVLFMIYGKTDLVTRIGTIEPGSAADAAGFQPGDTILAIDGAPVDTFGDIQRIVQISGGEALDVDISREGEVITLTVVPRMREIINRLGERQVIGMLGITSMRGEGAIVTRRFSPLEAGLEGTRETWFIISRTFGYLAGMIGGTQTADQLGGPIRIAEISGKVAERGFADLVSFIAVLSVSIGLINLFPIPILDGGHLLFYALEALRGRPVGERMKNIGYQIGFAALALLMIFVTWNDITRWADP